MRSKHHVDEGDTSLKSLLTETATQLSTIKTQLHSLSCNVSGHSVLVGFYNFIAVTVLVIACCMLKRKEKYGDGLFLRKECDILGFVRGFRR